ELRGVKLRELRMRYTQADGGDMADKRLDACPVEECAHLDPFAERSREQPAKRRAEARIDADDTPDAVDRRDLDLVRPHQARAVDIDQLPIEHVLAEQHLARSSLEAAEVDLSDRELDAGALDGCDAADRNVELAPGDAC